MTDIKLTVAVHSENDYTEEEFVGRLMDAIRDDNSIIAIYPFKPESPVEAAAKEVKAIPEVLKLDGYINAIVYNSPGGPATLLQKLFWDAVDAIQKEYRKSSLGEQGQEGGRFTREEYVKGLLVRFGLTEKEADEEINSYNEYLKQQ